MQSLENPEPFAPIPARSVGAALMVLVLTWAALTFVVDASVREPAPEAQLAGASF